MLQGNIISTSLMWGAAGSGHFCGAVDGHSHAPQIYSSPVPWGTHLFGHTQVHVHGLGDVVATERGPRALSPPRARASHVSQSCAVTLSREVTPSPSAKHGLVTRALPLPARSPLTAECPAAPGTAVSVRMAKQDKRAFPSWSFLLSGPFPLGKHEVCLFPGCY